jgi:porin
MLRILILYFVGSLILVSTLDAQPQEETLSGPDSHETGQGPHGHLLGDWGGQRSRLFERGVRFDFQYISDTLWNIKSDKKEWPAMWNRIRGTVDIDFWRSDRAARIVLPCHRTLARRGQSRNLSGFADEPERDVQCQYIPPRFVVDRETMVERTPYGTKFAAQDFYGAQHYAASFIFEPMGYALGNLFTDYESFDPPSTPAMEVRVVPLRHLYVKSMVEAEDRNPFAHNPTGLVPQFRGVPVSVSEIGFTPGQKASSVRVFDNVESRKGYSGVYQFGASYNPGNFTIPTNTKPKSGDYLLYWMASQALWRVDRREAKGLDATFAYDWSPSNINRNNTMFTAGLRFNEPLPLRIHNTMSVGYVESRLSQRFVPNGAQSWKPERAFEFNTLLDVAPMVLVQPVIQYYENVGGITQHAVVIGFRIKVEL